MKLTISERQWTRQVLELAKLYGWRRLHIRPARTKHGWATALAGDGVGWPDLFLVRGKRAIAAELKVEKKKPTVEQLDWLNDLQQAGVASYVWYPRDWDEIVRALQ